MKTLILYATKHGATKKCVDKLVKDLGADVTVINLKQSAIIDINNYRNIIIGSPVYAGSLLKEVKEFCDSNLDVLQSKKIGLFISCMKHTGGLQQLDNAFPHELTEIAIVKNSFGGEIRYSDMGFIQRNLVKLIMKTAAKHNPKEPAMSTKQNILNIDEQAISLFADKFH